MLPGRHTVVPKCTRRDTGSHTYPHMGPHIHALQAPQSLSPWPLPPLRLLGLLRGLRKGQQRGKGGLVKDTSKERGKKNEVEEIKSKGF